MGSGSVAGLEPLSTMERYPQMAETASKRTPKQAMRRDRFLVFLSLTTHFIPMSAAIVLLVLNLRGYYIGGELAGATGLDDLKSAALQITSKLHELFMQASLGLIVISIVRHEVAFGPGIPFGLIFGSLQLSNISYLWSKEFYGTLKAPFPSKLKKCYLVVLIIFGSLLFVTVGPASAITMRLRLGDWPAGGTDFYLNASREQIWPTSFTGSDVPLDCANISLTTTCISKDWPLIAESVMPFWPGLAASSTMPTEFTVTSTKSVKSVEIRQTRGIYHTQWTLATVQMSNLADSTTEISRLWLNAAIGYWLTTKTSYSERFKFRKDVTWSVDNIYQPLIMAVCHTSSNVTVFNILEGTIFMPNISSACDLTNDYITAASYMYLDRLLAALLHYNSPTSNGPFLQFVDLPVEEFGANSMGLVVAFPESWPGGQKMVSCAIDARWAPSKIQSRRSRTKLVTGQPLGWSDLGTCFTSGTKRITLKESWAKFLNPVIQDYNRTVFHEILRRVPSSHNDLWDYSGFVSALIESVISFMVTTNLASTEGSAVRQGILKGCTAEECAESCADGDGAWCNAIMPRKEFGNGGSISDLPFDFDKSKAAHFQLHATINGYAYSNTGVAAVLSCTVLICYCVLVVAHVVLSLKLGLFSQAWDTVSEVVALAMQSQPTEKLRNTCAGIVSTTAFTHLVRIGRTGDDNDHLELVFEDGHSADYLVPDEFYE